MDDPLSTLDSVILTDEPPHDVVTAELKAEFARLEREAEVADREMMRRAQHILEVLDDLDRDSGNARKVATCVIARAKLALDMLEELEGLSSASFLSYHTKYWSAVLAYFVSALAKLNSLLARSQRAFLRAPLLADGPELSGYKHRLR